MCQHLVHYNIYYLGLHDYMIRVVCWSFSPSIPSLEARNDTKPSHESSLIRAGGSKPAIQLLYHCFHLNERPSQQQLICGDT